MRRFLIILLSLVSFVACSHKDLCYNHPHVANVKVDFNWTEDPEKVPETMSVYFFKEGSDGEALRFEFTEQSGGKIRLLPGVYHAVCVNSDERNHHVADPNEYHSFYMTTKDAVSVSGLSSFGVTPQDLPKVKSGEKERMVTEPNNVWYSNARDIVIEDDIEQNVSLDIRSQLVTYQVIIRNVSNLKWVYGVSASMSGLSGGLYPGSGELSEEKVTIPFEARWNREDNTVTGSFTSFGHCPSDKNKHFLKVYAVLADNTYWDFTYDVTDIIHNSKDEEVISIELDGLPIPKPVVNGGGFKPTVGEWHSVEIELTM